MRLLAAHQPGSCLACQNPCIHIGYDIDCSLTCNMPESVWYMKIVILFVSVRALQNIQIDPVDDQCKWIGYQMHFSAGKLYVLDIRISDKNLLFC